MLVAGALLMGCTQPPVQGDSKQEAPAKPAQQKEVANVPEPQKDEHGQYNMTVAGQKVKLEDGSTVELVKIKNVNEKVKVAPMDVTVKSIKIFKWSGLSEAKKQEIATMSAGTPTLPDPFYFIQVMYDVENTKDKNIDFVGLRKIILSDGSQLDADANDFIIGDDDADTVYNGKVKKECTTGVVIKGKPEDITSAKLIFSETTDNTSFETITPEQQVEYKF